MSRIVAQNVEDGNGAMDSVTGAPTINVENWRISNIYIFANHCDKMFPHQIFREQQFH